jgi:3-deoxy-manno-octulosonate cytidylyltransferase (CMP-KDO synthetase)
MKRDRVLAVIPARYSSTRFPGKPLAAIAGKPMVAHVVERAREAGCFDEVVVATDDERIAAVAAAAGARPEDAAVVLNVQGDEPALPPANLRLLATFLRDHPEAPMATLALPGGESDLTDPNVVKVVCDHGGRALYFSRAAIPYPRNPGAAPVRRHVGLYGFRKQALLDFASWPESDLERSEGLEQLRALQHGMALFVLDAAAESVAVDVPTDVARAEAALAALRRTGSAARGRGPGKEK